MFCSALRMFNVQQSQIFHKEFSNNFASTLCSVVGAAGVHSIYIYVFKTKAKDEK